jgi:hypothetical protein
MSSIETVLDRHWEAFNTQDLDGIVADYAEGSFIITPFGIFDDLEEIEGLFTDFFEEVSQPGTEIELDQQVIHGDYAYIIWHGDTPDNAYEFATDTFVIQNGEIVAQTFAAKITPKD